VQTETEYAYAAPCRAAAPVWRLAGPIPGHQATLTDGRLREDIRAARADRALANRR